MFEMKIVFRVAPGASVVEPSPVDDDIPLNCFQARTHERRPVFLIQIRALNKIAILLSPVWNWMALRLVVCRVA
ncbi:hypothetical protein ACT9ST_03980 [Sphingobium limneticum]|uniref:hypothetical protein n=1 Tax=Sphingobium limneticum TaxID=1007511 RepID=UPI001478F1DD|nr:hypothetical protein [Sphingobium limneticum]